MEAEPKKTPKQKEFLVPNPRPGPDYPKASGWYRVAWSHRMPYLHGSFSTKEPYN